MEEPESKLDERGAAGGGNQPREGAPAEAVPSEQEEMNAEEAAEAQETVQEFMAMAAQQNVTANEAVPERRNHPGPYSPKQFSENVSAVGDAQILRSDSDDRTFVFRKEHSYFQEVIELI